MLCLTNITKKYKEKLALDDVSLELAPGIYGLLGPNGAGKSTLMNIVTGNLKPDGGQVLWDGKEIKSLGAQYRSIIGYAPQQQGLYDAFTGKRFLAYMATLKGISKKEMPEEIARVLSYVNMTEAANRPIGTYSGGMKQRVLLAQALLGNPKILILDEPTAGLDPKERIGIRNYIAELSKDKIILFATHVVSDIECIADHVLLIKKGQIVATGTPVELIEKMQGKVAEITCTLDDVGALQAEYKVGNIRQRKNGLALRLVGDTLPKEAVPVEDNIDLEDVYLYYFE